MDTRLVVRETGGPADRGPATATRDLAAQLAGGGGARLRLTGDPFAPGLDAVTGPALHSAGVRRIEVAEQVRTGEGVLRFIRLLREAASEGIEVTWRGALDLCASELLYHLPPPEGDARWRQTFRYGLCHYRVGPDFLLVSDSRRGRAVPAVLRDQARIAVLNALDRPERLPDGPALTALLDVGLVVRHEGVAVRLPYRLRRWPIPCTAV